MPSTLVPFGFVSVVQCSSSALLVAFVSSLVSTPVQINELSFSLLHPVLKLSFVYTVFSFKSADPIVLPFFIERAFIVIAVLVLSCFPPF